VFSHGLRAGRAPVIERILPSSAAAAEKFGDDPAAAIFPEERAVIRGSAESRQREFATARMCAHRALTRLGVPPAPVLPGPRGAPGWPAGVAGSITHCAGYRAAAVARTRDVRSLGIDAEPHEALPNGTMLDLIARHTERARLDELAAQRPGVCWDRLLFCAKESVYKAWSPLAGRWLGFKSADIAFDPEGGGFTAQLLVAGPLTRLHGRWLAEQGLLLAAVVVPAATLGRHSG
jgi:4'-phosphopantetheinyl transferase EntD